MPNLEKLKELHERITTKPENWDQECWAQQKECGTSYCMAGWACVLDGQVIDWPKNVEPGEWVEALHLVTGQDIDEAARDILGLDQDDSDRLFYCTNNDVALLRLENLIDNLEENSN